MAMAGCGGGDESDTLLTLTSGPFTTFNNDDDETDSSGDGDGDSGDGDGDSGDGDGDSGDGDGDSGDGDGDPGDGDGDSGDGDGDSGDGDGDSGDGDGDSGDGDGDPTGGGVGELCTDYSYFIGGCYGQQYIYEFYNHCYMYYNLFQDNPACFSAFEDFIVCISAADCGDFSEAIGCETELDDYLNAC
jgi:hypothetical protein